MTVTLFKEISLQIIAKNILKVINNLLEFAFSDINYNNIVHSWISSESSAQQTGD